MTITNPTQTELIILRDALTEYMVMLRSNPDTRQVMNESAYLDGCSPRTREIYLTAKDLRAQVNAKIR